MPAYIAVLLHSAQILKIEAGRIFVTFSLIQFRKFPQKNKSFAKLDGNLWKSPYFSKKISKIKYSCKSVKGASIKDVRPRALDFFLIFWEGL